VANSDELIKKKCKPCEGGVDPLEASVAVELMKALDDDWAIVEDGKAIQRTFEFSGYHRTIAFVNAVAWIAESEGHHPDLEVGYGKVVSLWTTHAIGGLSENDFICAAKMDRLLD
jgi:4a-hydroxytetrahydrobiopterin dehydratase